MSVFRGLSPKVFVACLSLGMVSGPLFADGDEGIGPADIIPDVEQASQVNDNTVGLVFSADELFNAALQDLDHEVQEHAEIRLVPILGKNDVQNVYDLLFLQGVDGAVFRTDAIEYVKRRGNFPTVGNVVNAMVKIHTDKIVVLANKSILSITDLDGEKVSLGAYASGEYVTGTVLSDAYGISFEPVYSSTLEGLEKLRTGEVSALIYLLSEDGEAVSSRVNAPTLQAMREFEADDQIHVLPLLGNNAVRAVYLPTTLTTSDLPGMLGVDEEIQTYSVDLVLGAYRWRNNNPRYEKTARFVDAFVESIHHLKTGDNKEFWGELNITAPVHGMLSLGVVSDVLAQRQVEREVELAAMKEAEAAEKEAERDAKLAALNVQREQILRLLDEKITGASDVDALQQLLDQVNSFADRLE